MLNLLIKNIKWNYVDKQLVKNQIKTISVIGKGENQNGLILDICYNSPENFSINIIHENERLEIKPIEILVHYKNMTLERKNKFSNSNIYKPKKIFEFSELSLKGKPGFYQQAIHFKSLCINSKSLASPNLKDAFNALNLINHLNDKL